MPSAENDVPDWLPIMLELFRATPCENYDQPGQDCITAGREVFSVEACGPCVARACARVTSPERSADA